MNFADYSVDLQTLQELAGHPTPLLTARYWHRRLYDLAGAVEQLPPLVPADTTKCRRHPPSPDRN
jgi:hypothetical protein